MFFLVLGENAYATDTWQYDFVVWWSYAKFPLIAFVLGSTLMTWLFVYFNRDRFQVGFQFHYSTYFNLINLHY